MTELEGYNSLSNINTCPIDSMCLPSEYADDDPDSLEYLIFVRQLKKAVNNF